MRRLRKDLVVEPGEIIISVSAECAELQTFRSVGIPIDSSAGMEFI